MRLSGILLLFAALARAKDPLLWGSLEAGPHSVGFHSSIAFDGSRKYDGRNARPILLDVWYPAASTSETTLLFARYLRVPEVKEHPWFQGRLEAFIRDVDCDDLFHKKTESELNLAERAAFDKLLAVRTAAHLDAAPAPGRFPVVLYHSGAGGSFEDNSVLFEYLASHGYVVVSSAFQSPLPKFIGNNMGGVKRSGPDLDFMAAQASGWSYADATRLGGVGHSAGAQNMLLWIGSPKCPARAFVSLDTTLEYTAEDFKGHEDVRRGMRKGTPPRIPVLLFAQAQRHPRFSTYDRYLRKSPHYEAEVTGLEHDDFLTHGYLGRTLRGVPEADATRRSYEEVCRVIRTFLDASLNGDVQAARSLREQHAWPPVSVRFKPGM